MQVPGVIANRTVKILRDRSPQALFQFVAELFMVYTQVHQLIDERLVRTILLVLTLLIVVLLRWRLGLCFKTLRETVVSVALHGS